ncbi:MAG TPA: hypothetical protein DEA82_01430 [Flavobacteriaceae bacterium]|nr:hypothetical protein [Flavobacteriaceae bacterium]MAY52673.1 hypothetical protein [Flavobacteriaceae bacterium]HBR52900.1 hypothetical protein [Flavobacteriaceae bacterium]|tara:strand:+ start:93 stop:815 length:723 start_codon:yes stop_codon:yes gene_type:complete
MKKNIFFTAILCCIACATLFSQNTRFTSSLFQLDEFIKRQDKFIDYTETDRYIGTPYNHPEYLNGNVYEGQTLLASNVALRYNAVADEMEIKESLQTPTEEARPLTKSPDIFVKIQDAIFVFAPYMGGIEGGGYFQVLYEGEKIDVFKKLNKKFVPEKPAKTSITRGTKAKFIDIPTYYLVSKNGKFYELPSSRNKKLKVFGKNKELISDYVSKNKLDLNDEKDLIATVIYFNSLKNIEL